MMTRVCDRESVAQDMPSLMPGLQPPTCSVVVCTRNRPAQLGECLAQISDQTLKPIEVIVVDNAPANRASEDVARRWQAKYILEPRVGLSRSRNRGAHEALGDVVAYIDDDASPRRDWLEKLVRAFQSEGVMAAGGRTVPPDAAEDVVRLCGLIQGYGVQEGAFVLDGNNPQWFEIAAFGGIGIGANMAFRRSIFAEWAGFDLRLGLPDAGCEEHFAFVSIVSAGHSVARVPDAVVVHPTVYTTEGLRHRFFLGVAHSTAYVFFLLIHLPQHRRKLIRFVFEALRGVRRDWKTQVDSGGTVIGVSRKQVYTARVRGCWLFVRSCMTSFIRR